MNRSLRTHSLNVLTILTLAFAFAVPGMAQTTDTDTDTAEVSLIVTGPSETPTEPATVDETVTPTPTPTKAASEDCPLKPDNANSIDPNFLASKHAQLGTPCDPAPDKLAGPVTQLPNTGAPQEVGGRHPGTLFLALTGIILIGFLGSLSKRRS